jgi:hypothetical protein
VKGKLRILFPMPEFISIYVLRKFVIVIPFLELRIVPVYSLKILVLLKIRIVSIAIYRTLTRSPSLPSLFNYEVLDHEDM